MHINVTILFILCQLAVSPVCDATAALYGSNLITQHFNKNKFLIFSSEDAHYEVVISSDQIIIACIYLIYTFYSSSLSAQIPHVVPFDMLYAAQQHSQQITAVHAHNTPPQAEATVVRSYTHIFQILSRSDPYVMSGRTSLCA